VDEFQGDWHGLKMAEAEFKTHHLLATFPIPEFAERDVTDDPRFRGDHLVRFGVPNDLL
jgi:CYTH domain-containing protein